MATATLARLVAGYRTDLLAIARKACEVPATKTAYRTPVDEGILRASWTASLDGAVRNATRASERGDLALVVRRLELGDTFHYLNGQPYAPLIEHEGHSAQAPGGMMYPSLAEWPADVRGAARGR